MKPLLIEVTPFAVSPQSLNESRDRVSGNPLVEGILATCEVKNGNGRYYPKELWDREIDKYNVLVRENRALGECVPPGTEILTFEGWKKIEDISEDEI